MTDFLGLLGAIIGLITSVVVLITSLLGRNKTTVRQIETSEQIFSRSKWIQYLSNFIPAFGGGWVANKLLFEISQGQSLPPYQIQGLRTMVHSIAPAITLLTGGIVAAIIFNRSLKNRQLFSFLIGFCLAFIVLVIIAFIYSL